MSFNLEKDHSAAALSHVMSETIAGQCTPQRRWMLQSKLLPVYFPNTIAKVSNSTVKSNTLVVFVCACACVRVLRAHNYFFRGGGGAFNMSRPRGPWFLNPSMCIPVQLQTEKRRN